MAISAAWLIFQVGYESYQADKIQSVVAGYHSNSESFVTKQELLWYISQVGGSVTEASDAITIHYKGVFTDRSWVIDK